MINGLSVQGVRGRGWGGGCPDECLTQLHNIMSEKEGEVLLELICPASMRGALSPDIRLNY